MARLWFLFEMAIGLTLPVMRMFFLTAFLVLTASVFAQPVLSLREALRIGLESNFDIRMAQNDVLIFKTITPPALDEFKELVKKVRNQARSAGMKRSDIHDAIKAARA